MEQQEYLEFQKQQRRRLLILAALLAASLALSAAGYCRRK